jgi:hypothetical protein
MVDADGVLDRINITMLEGDDFLWFHAAFCSQCKSQFPPFIGNSASDAFPQQGSQNLFKMVLYGFNPHRVIRGGTIKAFSQGFSR